jgi:hypothetical protein
VEAPALALCSYTIETGKKLILSSGTSLPNARAQAAARANPRQTQDD